MSMYWIIFIGFALLSWLVSSRLQGKFEKYSKIPMPNGMTGKDVAEKMLHDNGIYDVKVIVSPPLRLPPMSAVTPCSMLPLTLRYGCVRLWFRLLVSPLIS